MAIRSLLLVIAALTLVTGCKIKITVPEGGNVTSKSGTYDCATGSICTFDVSDAFFDDTFTAKAKLGYTFKQWKKEKGSFCGKSKKPCHLLTSTFDLYPSLVNILNSDKVFSLEPVFEKSTGSSSGSFDDDVYTNRVVQQDFDFEDNGQIDGTQTLDYDAAGRIIGLHYIYAGDGVDDSYEFRYRNVRDELVELTYDTSGRLITLDSLTQYILPSQPFGSNSRFTYDYEYDGDKLSKNTQVFFDENGGMFSRTFFTFKYTGDLITTVFYENDDSVLNFGLSEAAISRADNSYNTKGEIVKIVYVNYKNEVLTAQTFEWNNNQTLAYQSLSNGSPGSSKGFHEYEYASNGCMASDLDGLIDSDGILSKSDRSIFIYGGSNLNTGTEEDEGDNGSVDGTKTFIREDKSFLPLSFPDVFPDIRWSQRATNCTNRL